MGISGNDQVDTAAKSALILCVTPMKIPAADLVPRVTNLIVEKRQQFWNSCTGNKPQAIRPTVGGRQQKSSLIRRNEVVINRLVTPDAHILICCQVQTNLSARLVSVHYCQAHPRSVY